MNKQFGGFTQQQTEVLARKMGFSGPMEQFQNYLRSSPANAQRFQAYESKAKQMVESASQKRGFAEGGNVAYIDTSTGQLLESPSTPAKTPVPATTVATSPGGPSTAQANTTPAQVSAIQTTTLDKDGKPVTTTVPFVAPNPESPGAQLTADMIANPQNYVTPVVATPMTVSPEELISTESGQVGINPDVVAAGVKPSEVSVAKVATATPAAAAPTAIAAAPVVTAAPTVTTALASPDISAAAQDMAAIQGTVSPEAIAVAATAMPSADATVQGQLNSLMQQFEGGQTPPWAAGAMRNAEAVMAQRGLGASSIAAGAITQAAMESTLQIAIADANTYSQFEMASLNNRQQASLQNAQAFLTMDMANLSAENQTEMFKNQAIIQGLFTDQAATNASAQFNATSQGQTDQFFASLKSQTSQYNASQQNAMSQFNVAQKNSMAQFNAAEKNTVAQFNAAQKNAAAQFTADQLNTVNTFNRQVNDARDQFNAANRLVIDQSNANWMRSISTANNAAINEANRINAQAATGMTNAAINDTWQRERDYYQMAFTSSENDKAAVHSITMANIQAKNDSEAAVGAALGEVVSAGINAIFSL